MKKKELDQILAEMPDDFRSGWESMSDNEKTLFLKVIDNEEIEDLLYDLDWKEQPVSPYEFFSNEYFTGKNAIWDPKEHTGIFPLWKEELCYVLDPQNGVTEWILSGAMGLGKSTVALWAQGYLIYKLHCLRNPHKYMGLLESAPIELFFMSVNLTTASDVGIDRLESIINGSPYFRENFPANRRRRKKGYQGTEKDSYKLEFPPFLSIIEGSRETHFISRDILGGIMDEANFIQQPKNTGAQEYGSSSRMFNLYQGLSNRIETRFMNTKQSFGLLCLISSAATRFDFLEHHKKKQRSNPHVRISEFALYEMKPWNYGSKRFRVFVGSESGESRILKDGEVVANGSQVIEVPIEHLDRYEADVARALKEISGIPSERVSPLIPTLDAITNSIDPNLKNPFKVEFPVIGHLSSAKLDDFLEAHHLAKWQGSILVPRYHTNCPRFIHVDLSKSKCATGFAMGCVCGTTEVEMMGADGSKVVNKEPIIHFDIVLSISPPKSPEEVGYAKIRHFIKYLRDVLHFPIDTVSFDGWNSVDSRQILQNEGFDKVEILSMDRTPIPYLSTRAAHLEGRIRRYAYPHLDHELIHLRLFEEAGKVYVEKPPDGSKDCSDSMAGVIHWCQESVRSEGHHAVLSNLVSGRINRQYLPTGI